MRTITLYHYVSRQRRNEIKKNKALVPLTPFNPLISGKVWHSYAGQFSFPIARFYSCHFFEPLPRTWVEYGLFDLLMKEFAKGDYLLKSKVTDNPACPILVRDHKFHSPKEYEVTPEIWQKKEVRNSRPDLRNKWHQSVIPLRNYTGQYACPEVLVGFPIPLNQIAIERISRLPKFGKKFNS